MKIRAVSLIIASSLLAACSTANHVQRIADADTVVPLHQEGEQAGVTTTSIQGKKPIRLAAKVIVTQVMLT